MKLKYVKFATLSLRVKDSEENSKQHKTLTSLATLHEAQCFHVLDMFHKTTWKLCMTFFYVYQKL